MQLRYLLKSPLMGRASALGGATLIMAVCGISTNLIWANLVPQEIFGGFKVIFAIVNMIGTLCLLGTGQASLMSAAQNADGNLARLVFTKLIANAGGSLLLLTAAFYYTHSVGSSESIAIGLVVAALLFPVYNISDIWTSWLNGKARFRELATGRALIYILPLFSMITVVIFSISELWQVVLIYFTLTGVQNVIMLKRVLNLRAKLTNDEGILRLGRHATFAMMAGGIVSLDVIILNHFFSVIDVAIYSIALVLPELLKALLTIINQLFAPKVNDGRPLAIFWQTHSNNFLIITIGLIVIGVVGFFLIPIIVPLLFSEKYIASSQYSKWLWLVMACVGSLSLLGNLLIATRKLIFTYGAFLGYPILLTILLFSYVADGVAGIVTARVLAMVGLHLFYGVGFYLSIKQSSLAHVKH